MFSLISFLNFFLNQWIFSLKLLFNTLYMHQLLLKLFKDYGFGATNVTFQQHKIGREERAQVLGRYSGFRGCTIWFTGLSGAGKTTVAFAVEKILIQVC